jgi:hypothetical protein
LGTRPTGGKVKRSGKWPWRAAQKREPRKERFSTWVLLRKIKRKFMGFFVEIFMCFNHFMVVGAILPSKRATAAMKIASGNVKKSDDECCP